MTRQEATEQLRSISERLADLSETLQARSERLSELARIGGIGIASPASNQDVPQAGRALTPQEEHEFNTMKSDTADLLDELARLKAEGESLQSAFDRGEFLD